MSDLLLEQIAAQVARPPYHGGLLVVTPSLLDELGITFTGCTVQGDFQESGVFARLHDTLMLPDDVHVSAIWIDWMRYMAWFVRIEGPSLPPVEEGYLLPRFVAVYHREGLSMRFVEFRRSDGLAVVDFYADYYCSDGTCGLPRLSEEQAETSKS